MDSINLRIKQLRIENSLSQEEFAKSLGINRHNLTKVETEKQHPTLEMIKSIVTIYHISLDWLFFGDCEKYENVGKHYNYNYNTAEQNIVNEQSIYYSDSNPIEKHIKQELIEKNKEIKELSEKIGRLKYENELLKQNQNEK